MLKAKRKPKAKGWYAGPVAVAVTAEADPALPDASPGSGLDPASVPAARKVKKSGVSRLAIRTADLLGNESRAARLTIRIDRKPPKVRARCPRTAGLGARTVLKVRVGDRQSGVKGRKTRTVRVDTSSAGRAVTKVKARDRVGNVTRKRCVTLVRP